MITELFKLKYPGFIARSGVEIMVDGYELRFDSVLSCEESHEIIKRVFVYREEFEKVVIRADIDTVLTHLRRLSRGGHFRRGRDEFWYIVNRPWSLQAQKRAEGKIKLISLDSLLKEMEKYAKRDHDFRKMLLELNLME